MRLRARLGRAEGAAHKTFSSDHPPELTPAEWLEKFETLGREWACAAEPDYSVAPAAYRDALDKAQADLGPGEEMPALWRTARGDTGALSRLPRRWKPPINGWRRCVCGWGTAFRL